MASSVFIFWQMQLLRCHLDALRNEPKIVLRWKQRLVSTDGRVVFKKWCMIYPDESPEVQTEEHATPFVGRDKTGFSLPRESRSSFPLNCLLWPSHGCLRLPLHTRTSVPEARFFSLFSLSSSFPGGGEGAF